MFQSPIYIYQTNRLSHLFSNFLDLQMFLLGNPFFPQFILFCKVAIFSWKIKLYIENYLFLNFIEIIYQISKICCKKIHGLGYKLLASRLLLTCCYNKIWFFLLQCVPYYNDVKLLQTPYIYIYIYIYIFQIEMKTHIYLTLVMSQVLLPQEKTIFPM